MSVTRRFARTLFVLGASGAAIEVFAVGAYALAAQTNAWMMVFAVANLVGNLLMAAPFVIALTAVARLRRTECGNAAFAAESQRAMRSFAGGMFVVGVGYCFARFVIHMDAASFSVATLGFFIATVGQLQLLRRFAPSEVATACV